MPKLLELFSGCGGFTLGSHKAGFETSLAIDIDPILTSSFKLNFPETKLLLSDVSEITSQHLSEILPNGVDGIIGGPPCQGFSGIGKNCESDPRRDLLSHFFRVVAEVNPKFFVMENVPGLVFPKNRKLLDKALRQLDESWHVIGPVILDAADFGAPTKRKRVFVFGFRHSICGHPTIHDITQGAFPKVNVHDAIFDLQFCKALDDQDGLSIYSNMSQLSRYANSLRASNGRFSGQLFTSHKPETVNRFSKVKPGNVDLIGKHKRLSWDGLCPTLRAGTGSDKGSYQSVRPLHPTEDRVITPREAARLQGFPDEFLFHSTIWHSFRMIGNSVSPIIAEKLLTNIKNILSTGNSAYKTPIALESY